MAQTINNLPAIWDTWVQSLDWEGKIKILQCQLLGNKYFFFFSLETMSSEFFEKIKFREKQDTISPDRMDMQRGSHHGNKEIERRADCMRKLYGHLYFTLKI